MKTKALTQKLRESGYEGEASEFQALLMDCYAACFRDLPPKDLLLMPTEGARYCLLVRRHSGHPTMPEWLIMKALMAMTV